MDFTLFVQKKYRDVYDAADRTALQRLGRSMDRAAGMQKLLIADDPALHSFPFPTLIQLADAHRDYQQWKEGATSVRRMLAQSSLSIPDGALDFAITPDEFAALERTGRMCLRSGHADHSSWFEAFKGHMELWRSSVALSVAHGSASIKLIDPDHEDASDFEGLISSRTILAEIRGYQWMALRRGERHKVIEIVFELPWNGIIRQTENRLSSLGLIAQKRGAQPVAEELVKNNLESAVRAVLDQKAQLEAMKSARNTYMGLLATPALQANVVIAAFVGSDHTPLGLAVLNKAGEIIDHQIVQVGANIANAAAQLIEQHKPTAGILPIASSSSSRLDQAEKAFGAIPVQRIHDVAVAVARKDINIPPASASAVVLARRALKPGQEWARIDPAALSIGEYHKDLNKEMLTKVLAEARVLSAWERRTKQIASRPVSTGRQASTVTVKRRLNPLVKTIRDLRPGMVVDGIITNITRFGAFVNIGLPIEGMIHVSQLSDEYVEDPALVVRVGQQVTARVLDIVPEKQRIALSLKPTMAEQRQSRPPQAQAPAAKPPVDGPQPPSSPDTKEAPYQSKREAPKTRSAALADLDALFKK